MSRTKKLKILIPVIMLLFLGAYSKHRLLDKHDITGRLSSKQMSEISGIAASTINPGIYYVHNDSGDTSRFFAITPDGKIKTTIYFKGDTRRTLGVTDCEDIDVGPGPEKGKSYVYLGDIGDNSSNRKTIAIYRFLEKKSWASDSLTTATAVTLHLKYPDGPKDAETLIVDPIEKLLCIVSKRGDTVAVYTTPLNYKANDTLTLTKRTKLFFAGYKPFKWITAGDISKDGKQILLKSYEKVYYWRREPNEHIWDVMTRKPQELNYEPEKQGEAIGFTPDGTGYYTTSEGVFSPIYYYKIP
ncbi:hypothetical protein SAMN05216464_10528 [Mucilaginibacter pineti]|uniref:WD40-like Beta Propeller Repeat n=1 Tax=Mucilaginibacter pineti TaxID=1391627 RepID=A0A1G7BHC0_9SPHI|nr:hypothetical protein [Mucilaginibacter pineti]SDE26511.1 hypothetical protein SAMN05216464_10528 [Mucilaginibacter pineti]